MRRLAVCGKGGVGKTAFAAMLTRALMEHSRSGRVLAIDADPALGLAQALGMQVDRTVGQVREAILATARAGGDAETVELAGMLDYMVMEALVEDRGVALLAMGRSESLGCFCSVNDILRDAIELLSSRFDTIVIDGEAGVEQINRQVMHRLDHLIVVSDASARGRQVAALLKMLVEDKKVIDCARMSLVFNRVRDDHDVLRRAAERVGLELLGLVPEDPAISSFDLAGRPLSELPDDCAALTAVRAVARSMSL